MIQVNTNMSLKDITFENSHEVAQLLITLDIKTAEALMEEIHAQIIMEQISKSNEGG